MEKSVMLKLAQYAEEQLSVRNISSSSSNDGNVSIVIAAPAASAARYYVQFLNGDVLH